METESPPAETMWSLSKPGARRSLVLCALGAMLGLAIAGLGLFTAKGTRTSSVPAEDVALVNQVPILMSDYVQQVRALYDVSLSQATPAQKRTALDGMIREELYVQRGVELGVQSDTIEVRTALVGAVEALSAADARMAQPSDADLRRFYRANLSTFADEGVMEVEDHLLPSSASPQAIELAAAALHASAEDRDAPGRIAPGSKRMTGGEEFYFAAKIHLGDQLFAVAQRLARGAVSPPVAMQDGIHLLLMRKNIPPQTAPFEQIRDKVLASYVDAQAKVLTAANERFLRKRADIQAAKGFE